MTREQTERWAFLALDLVGGTPTSARETRALPKFKRIIAAKKNWRNPRRSV
jgi:hypothetical protein